MKKSNLAKLTTNEAYLEECMKVLSLKTNATGFYIYKKNEKFIPQYFVNVESDVHQTISILGNKYRKRVRFDGTNYIIDFRSSENGDFVVYNQELGVRYCCSDQKLDDNVHIKTVYRISGDEQEYYKYLYSDGKCIVLEYKANTEDGKLDIENKETRDLSDDELVEYTNEYYSKCREIDDEVEAELKALGIDNFGKSLSEPDEKWEEITNQRIAEIIETYSDGEFSKDNYNTINFISDVAPIDANEQEEFVCILPEDVHNFDYHEYRKNKNCGMGFCLREDGAVRNEQENIEEDDDLNEEFAYDEELAYDEDFADDEELKYEEEFINDEDENKEQKQRLEAITVACIAGEEYGITNSNDFSVKFNGEEVEEEQYKNDILDEITNSAMDLQLEVDFYKDNYQELSQEFEIVKSIIATRRKNIEPQDTSLKNKVIKNKDAEKEL